MTSFIQLTRMQSLRAVVFTHPGVEFINFRDLGVSEVKHER